MCVCVCVSNRASSQMKPKPSKKNRINMHDIIAQPLGALPGAVDAILRRPEEMDNVEVQSIFKEASFILLRAEEAQSACDCDAFCALFKLFSEGFAHNEASFEKGIETFERNSTLLQTLRGIFCAAVEQRVFPVQSAAVVELLQVIGSLCDGGGIKDACGALFMEGLANMLEGMYRSNAQETRANFLAQRAAATALINLVKGSKQNKQRIVSWAFLADCCALSVDVFFQLQCVELFFRLSRHNKSLFAQLDGRLPSRVLDNIRHLPNDSTLLPKMIELLCDINQEREEVLSFPLVRTVVASTTITEKTVSYFTMDYFVVLVMSCNADNVTIPYKCIRSVTLGKDGRVNFRLDEFPAKLGALLSHAPGEDTVTLFMSPEQLAILRDSRIHSWIVNVLREKKERRKSGADGAVRAPSSSSTSVDAAAKRHRSESLQLAGNESQVWSTFEKMIKSSDDTAKNALEKMRQLAHDNNEFKHQEVAAILDASMQAIQRVVDESHVATDGLRAAFRETAEGNIQDIEQRLQGSQSKVFVAVEKLNHALQGLKESNTAIHEQIACIEITLQQSLEISREEEAKICKSLKTEGEENIGRLEAVLDQQLMGQLNPMSAISQLLKTNIFTGSVF